MPVSGDLPRGVSVVNAEPDAPLFTEEQLQAIERRDGALLLAAGAGSGKTSVLVERFVRAVLEDGVEVAAILAITFTDKAAAELRERIRSRFRNLGADEAARATEGAFISTIHGFCARLLRAEALAAGLDPAFAVLDQPEAQRVADAAFDEALEALAREHAGAVELIASYGTGALRGATLSSYGQLRSAGQTSPVLPALPPAPDPAAAAAQLRAAAAAAARELGAQEEPSAKVAQAIERLQRCDAVSNEGDPWPGDLDSLKLPGGNGAALSTPVCLAYTEALGQFRRACEHRRAREAHLLLDLLLRSFSAAYARRKHERGGLDFEDLELLARDLLGADGELRERYRSRFAHVMVDELQDTNRVQLDLIEHVADGNRFMVGDAYQSIYAFRHADVTLFEQLGRRLEADGARLELRCNFRSRPEILDAVGAAFRHAFRPPFEPLEAGRPDEHLGAARVELHIVNRAGDWPAEGLAAPWRIAEAGVLADRVAELIAQGAAPRDVVVLTRATTDLRAYERALEERGVPTYVIGGRGYWAHPQVVDVVSYLRALANPRDEEALYTVLLSPMVGASVDAVVMLAAAARAAESDAARVLREPEGRLDELAGEDRSRLARFASWFDAERAQVSRSAVSELIERGLERSGYDLAVLGLPGGRRRLANVRKLMRLALEHEADAGRDLRGFLDLVRGRQAGWAGYGDARESEAPVEGEALDAVRLMTIHRAKGLEFEIVCVADLGRQPRRGAEVVRIGRDGRFGLRLSEPGTARAVPALDYDALGEAQLEAQAAEERRLFYVAMTRARERLILTGAAKLDALDSERAPIGWITQAMGAAGVEPRLIEEEAAGGEEARPASGEAPAPAVAPVPPKAPAPADAPGLAPPRPGPPLLPRPGPRVSRLSYSSLEEYRRCRYRFYVERVLGIPPVSPRAARATGGTERRSGDRLAANERGIVVHSLLERLDFRRPAEPSPEALAAAARLAAGGEPASPRELEEIAAMIRGFAQSELCARLGRARDVRREERFAFSLDDQLMVNGAIDVLAREPDGRILVVDYKTDRLGGQDPSALASAGYGTQRLVYALAMLRTGAAEVEVAHVFLEEPARPAVALFSAGRREQLEQELAQLASGVLADDFEVTEDPHAAICSGCPAEGGLCSWPLEMTRREAADRLF